MSDELHPTGEPQRTQRGLRKLVPTAYLITALIAAVVSVLIYAGVQYTFQTRNTAQVANSVLDNPLKAQSGGNGTNALKNTSESFRQIAKKLGPAVVNIKSTRGAKKAPRGMRRGRPGPDDGGEGMDDPFREFFERFGAPFPFHGMPDQSPQTSLGSGVIIDKSGIVVTNNHVVEGASEVMVTLSNEKTDLKAKILGSDPRSDLAVLKIEKGGEFPFAEWSDSDTVEVGDWAIAIGSPFALGQSVTVGIVSAKGRSAQGLGAADYSGELIQTDAAINPGNSGGPLCDLDGRVMGINTAIYTRSGGYMGIGFAIPSNLAKDVVGKLIKDGKITRGWLGVLIQPLDPEMAKELGIKEGVGIHEVIPDSPAAAAGIQAGDVIVEVDGKEVKEVTALQRTISGYKPGQTVRIKVVSYTDKKSRTVSVKIGTLPDKDEEIRLGERQGEPDKLGITVAKAKDGLVIDSVVPNSLADQLGLEVGDVIVRVNRKKVDSVESYSKSMDNSKRVYLEIKRKGRTLFFQFGLPQ